MDSQQNKDKIIRRALSDAPQEGWSQKSLARAAASEGFDALMAEALFPALPDATRYVSEYFDRLLMDQLGGMKSGAMRTRDKIAAAVMTRLDLMAPYRDGLKAIALRPRGVKSVWRTADKIWVWAGDTATDYNRYTKRGLLSGVIVATTLFWLNDTSPGFRATSTFLDRRIDNILQTGRVIGMARQFLSKKGTAAIVFALLVSTSAFAQSTPAPTTGTAAKELMDLYVGPTADTLQQLDKANRSVSEISDFVSNTVADALQFSPGHVNDKLTSLKINFTDAGYQSYLAFLGAQPFAKALSAQSVKLSTVVNDAPQLIGQGANGGRYAWAFELPVLMSAGGQNVPATIRIQVGRNAAARTDAGVVIENWQVSATGAGAQQNVQNPSADLPAP